MKLGHCLSKWLCSAATLFRINFNYLKWKNLEASFVFFSRKRIFCIHLKLNGSLMSFPTHLSLDFYHGERKATPVKLRELEKIFFYPHFTPSYHWPTSLTWNSWRASEKLLKFLCTEKSFFFFVFGLRDLGFVCLVTFSRLSN